MKWDVGRWGDSSTQIFPPGFTSSEMSNVCDWITAQHSVVIQGVRMRLRGVKGSVLMHFNGCKGEPDILTRTEDPLKWEHFDSVDFWVNRPSIRKRLPFGAFQNLDWIRVRYLSKVQNNISAYYQWKNRLVYL